MKKINERNRHLKESSGYEFRLIFTNNSNEYVEDLNHKNYKDVSAIVADAQKMSIEDTGSDDVWIDEVIHMRGEDFDIDWTKFMCGGAGGSLDQDIVTNVFEDAEYAIKAAFLVKAGYDIEEYIEDVTAMNVKHDNMLEGNFKYRYPESFVTDYVENFYSDVEKLLQKYNMESYMDYARAISDAEVNGNFTGDMIGDYYVYMYRA